MVERHRIQRFEVLGQIGSGGTGQVYRARDPELERDVAIKMLSGAVEPSELSDHDTVDLRSNAPATSDDLLREARMMARLSHTNVLAVYEVGLCDGQVFLVMELIDGTDLSVWLEAPRTTPAILDVFLQAARGVAAAHQHGIVHRDIKPENILIGRDGRVHVADFGLSRLTGRPGTAMIYVGDDGGTPRYMAPELWRGQPATPCSDVYALCLALTEAVGGRWPEPSERVLVERGLGKQLRRLIERGLADDPAARPELAQLIAALEARPSRWQRRLVATSVASAAGAAIAIGVLSASPTHAPDSTPPCDPDPAAVAARWDAGQFDALTRLLIDQSQPGYRNVAERIASEAAGERQAIDQGLAGACQLARDGAITWDQYRIRASCFLRRAFELSAGVELVLETKPDLLAADGSFDASVPASRCTTMLAPPITGDTAADEALWRRYVHSEIYAVPTRAEEHIAELSAVGEAAAAIGDTELVAMTMQWTGVEQRFLGQLALADETMQRAYRIALDIKATMLATKLLRDRSAVADARDDSTAARSLAELARDLGDNEGATPRGRAHIYLTLGNAFNGQGEPETAIRHLRHALEILQANGIPSGDLNLRIREALLSALTRKAGQDPGTIPLALQTAEQWREYVGDRDHRYGSALFMVANAYAAVDNYADALPYRRRAMELLSAALPADHTNIPKGLAFLASDLYGVGDLKAARREVIKIQKLTANDPRYVQNKWLDQGFFAMIDFELGKLDDGLALATQAHEEAISTYGRQHPDTLDLREQLAVMELEVNRLDDVARDVAAIEAACHAKPQGNRLRLLRLRGTLVADLAIARGKPRDAETAARGALDGAVELHATDRDRARFHARLGASLVAQRRWTEGHATLDASLALLTKAHARPDDIAEVEIKLAVAEASLGRRGPALARARRARAVLGGYPGRLRARNEADELLRRLRDATAELTPRR